MSRPLARSAVLVLLALTAAGVVLEGGLRLAAWLPVARHGHDEPPLADAAVVVYGDSTPYGLGNEVRFSDEIARRTGVVVANRSWPGLGSTQVARLVHDDLGERRMIQADHFHPTDDGQRAIAARVLEALRVRGWLQRASRDASGHGRSLPAVR